MRPFNGLEMNLGSLPRLSNAQSRSISAENPTGGKGKGAMSEPTNRASTRLGRGWKCRGSVEIEPQQNFTLADIEGSGSVQSMWFDGDVARDFILRVYWDQQEQPSIECPMPDFFGLPWVHPDDLGNRGPLVRLNSLPVSVNPNRGLNCFWVMPFRRGCRITVENTGPAEARTCYHQINYTLTDVPDDAAYFHAQFRHVNPQPYGQPFTIVDGVRGKGHYVGTVMGWGMLNLDDWWGEGEIKFYIDGDEEFPTICGTGVEDYFGGSYAWKVDDEFIEHSSPFLGMHQRIPPEDTANNQLRHAMYRWHVMDPIRFERDLRVTNQALNWGPEGFYVPGEPEISSVAYWYQNLPAAPFPALPDRDALRIL